MAERPIPLSPPADGDYDPAAGAYIRLAPVIEDATLQLESQREAVVKLFDAVSEEQAAFRYAPGKWSIREVLGHVCDAERIFAYRLLRIGRGDETPLPGFDENDYVPAGAFESRPVASLIEEWSAVRDATVALVRGMPRDAWPKRGIANGKSVTAAALVYIAVGHVEHHLRILEDRYHL